MYAIIETGGKQYPVAPGDDIQVELIETETGAEVAFDRVVAVSTDDGTLLTGSDLEKAKVTATVEGKERGKKIIVFKFKRRKHYRRRTGHRQHCTRGKISEILI